MHRKVREVGAALAVFTGLQGSSYLTAQTAGGPTMQQTVEFISKLYERQSTLRSTAASNASVTYEFNASVGQQGSCGLAVRRITRTNDGNPGPSGMAHRYEAITTLIELSGSDPASITLNPIASAVPELYEVTIGRASQTAAGAEAKDKTAALPFSAEKFAQVPLFRGAVSSVEGNTVLFIMDDGRLISLTPGTTLKVELMVGNDRKPAALSDIAPGDTLLMLHGDKKVTFLRNAPSSSGPTPYAMPPVADKDMATKLAKALVHAMVLCHKEEEPSLF